MLNRDQTVLFSSIPCKSLSNYILLGKYLIFRFASATNILENFVQVSFLLTQEYLVDFDESDWEGSVYFGFKQVDFQ